MAIGKFTVFDQALEKISGVIDLENDDFFIVLTGYEQELTADFAGTSGDCLYADLEEEVSGTGYTAGGAELAAAWTRVSAEVFFSGAPVTWIGLDTTAKYAVVRKDGGSDDLLGYFDIDDSLPTGRVFPGIDVVLSFPDSAFVLRRKP